MGVNQQMEHLLFHYSAFPITLIKQSIILKDLTKVNLPFNHELFLKYLLINFWRIKHFLRGSPMTRDWLYYHNKGYRIWVGFWNLGSPRTHTIFSMGPLPKEDSKGTREEWSISFVNHSVITSNGSYIMCKEAEQRVKAAKATLQLSALRIFTHFSSQFFIFFKLKLNNPGFCED